MNAKGRTQPRTLPSTSVGTGALASATDAIETKATPAFAIFTLPKPFDDPHIACIQRNAISSWKALGEDVDVILIGNEAGIEQTAEELGTLHVSQIQRNEYGTPLVSDAFKGALATTAAEVLVFCNADVILLQDFKHALTDVMQSALSEKFLAIGRRTNLGLRESVDFSDRLAVRNLLEQTAAEGALSPIVCKEYFAFGRDQFDSIPPFAVGRGNWDNWMVAETKRIGVPVIDLSCQVTAIHQTHDYRHVEQHTQSDTAVKENSNSNSSHKRQRKHCYLSGAEARANQRLAGGKHIITGSTASHRLTKHGLVKNRLAWLNLPFWTDLPRFVRLVRQLFLG